MTTWERVTYLWKQKILFGTTMTISFWLGYFVIPSLTPFPLIKIPISPFDEAIPFIPEAAWIYVLQIIATPGLGWLMASKSEVTAFFISHLALISVSLTCFYLLPTFVSMPTAALENRSLYHLIVSIDVKSNACPSLHAGYATLFAGCLRHCGYGGYVGKMFGTVFCLMIIASALLTKQHMLLDVICGSFLGWLAAGLFKRVRAA